MPGKKAVNNFDWIKQRVAAPADDDVSIFPKEGAPVLPASAVAIQLISPKYLLDNPYQSRIDYRNIESLADKMRSMGFVGTLIARRALGKAGYYQIAFGHRRRRSAEMAGTPVPVEIRDLTDQEMILYAASENLEREDLTPLEEGIMFLRMNTELKMTQEEIAQFVGEERKTTVKRGYVRERMELAQLAAEHEQVRQHLERNPQASIRAMRSLAGLDESHISFLLNGMEHFGWTGDQVEQRAKVLREGGAAAEALLHAEEQVISGGEDEHYDQALAPGEDQTSEMAPPLRGGFSEPSVSANVPEGKAALQPDKISKEIDRSVLLSGAVKRFRRYSNSLDTGTLSEQELGALQEIATSVVVVMAARSPFEQKQGALQEIADLIQELLSQAGTAKT